MRLADLVQVSRRVAETTSRLQKVAVLEQCLAQLKRDEVRAANAWLAGLLPQGRVGVGPSLVGRCHEIPPGAWAGDAARPDPSHLGLDCVFRGAEMRPIGLWQAVPGLRPPGALRTTPLVPDEIVITDSARILRSQRFAVRVRSAVQGTPSLACPCRRSSWGARVLSPLA